jgi:succinate-acetate transporter protein
VCIAWVVHVHKMRALVVGNSVVGMIFFYGGMFQININKFEHLL